MVQRILKLQSCESFGRVSVGLVCLEPRDIIQVYARPSKIFRHGMRVFVNWSRPSLAILIKIAGNINFCRLNLLVLIRKNVK